MGTNNPKVSIIVINWNGKEDTAKCLDSLRQLNYPDFDVIVVDNASSDSSVEYLKKEHPDVTYIENDFNSGWTGGNNIGAKHAIAGGAEYILTLNNDVILDKDLLKQLVDIAESDRSIGFVGPKIYYYDKPTIIYSAGLHINYNCLFPFGVRKGKTDKGQFSKIEEVNWIDDIVLLIRRDVIEKIGLYDEDYFMYVEETDLCYRAQKAGFKIIFNPKAIAWHRGAASSGSGFNPFVAYYKIRNRILFVRKNLPAYWLIGISLHILLFVLFQTIKSLLTGRLEVISAMTRGIAWHVKNLKLDKGVK